MDSLQGKGQVLVVCSQIWHPHTTLNHCKIMTCTVVCLAFKKWEKNKSNFPVCYKFFVSFCVWGYHNGWRLLTFCCECWQQNQSTSNTHLPSVLCPETASMWSALLIAALNDLNIFPCDNENEYMSTNCCEQIYTSAGPEFGSKVLVQLWLSRQAQYIISYTLKSTSSGKVVQS